LPKEQRFQYRQRLVQPIQPGTLRANKRIPGGSLQLNTIEFKQRQAEFSAYSQSTSGRAGWVSLLISSCNAA